MSTGTSAAGPSRPSPVKTPSTPVMSAPARAPAPRRSPGRSFSLSIKSKGKLPMRTGLHDRRWDLDFGGGGSKVAAAAPAAPPAGPAEMDEGRTPTTATTSTTDSSLRRTVSSEDTKSTRSTSITAPPPHPPPKDPIPRRPPERLLSDVRAKMSTKDQEAMRKLRLTMDISDSSSSGSHSHSHSHATSPLSPMFVTAGSSSSHGHGRPPMGSRRSTGLSREIVSEDLDDEQPILPIAAQHALPPAKAADFVVAVVGHKGSGKSTIIRRATKAWGVSTPVATTTEDGLTLSSCFSQIEPGGKIKHAWKVEFLEMDIGLLHLDTDESLWPALVAEIHATILCYDAQNQDSLKGLDVATRRLSADGKPAVIFACKSDPDAKRAIDPAEADACGQPYNVGLIEVTQETSDGKSKMRNGLRWLIYKLEQRQRREQRRLLAQDLEVEQQRHMAARLEGVMSPDSDASSGGHRIMYRRSLGLVPPEAVSGEDDGTSDRRSSSSSLGWMMKSPLRVTTAVEPPAPAPKAVTIDTKPETPAIAAGAAGNSDPPLYLSLRSLLDKLFGAIISLSDPTFIRAFIMTYRRFCTPAEVMQEFVNRCHEVQREGISKDVKMWALQKMTGTIIDWLQAYPGDLCDDETTRLFRIVLGMVDEYMFMAHLTVELIYIERKISTYTDPDLSWAVKPPGQHQPQHNRRKSVMLSPDELVIDDNVLYELDDSSISRSDVGTPVKERGNPGDVSASSLQMAEEASIIISRINSGSETKLASTVDSKSVNSSSGAGTSTSASASPTQWASAIDWIQSNDPNVFATELTKLHWELFCAIRPRDVLRHDLGKEADTPVGKSIAFFNRISRWVTTMILASPKAKLRARIYERFTLIAHQLRRLHNYDSLYAVISGMQETSIHRLSQTHSHVQLGPGIEKDWQSHLKLMDPRGGYVHYRRALQADLSHGRAAIPLMTTLLGLINRLQSVRREDKRDSDGAIQWDKFARFYEILSIIPECQNKPAMVSGSVSPAFRRMIEETPIITDEDALFERSRMLEPAPSQRGHLRDGTGRVLRRLANLGL